MGGASSFSAEGAGLETLTASGLEGPLLAMSEEAPAGRFGLKAARPLLWVTLSLAGAARDGMGGRLVEFASAVREARACLGGGLLG